MTNLAQIIHSHEELRAAYERIDELESTLTDARMQIEYLHARFPPTGTSEATLARINEVLG